METCENCNNEYDNETEGVTTSNRYTGEEHEFCSDGCLIAWAKGR